jgi:hypothetical protein
MNLRAHRLGWNWSDDHESFIRISTPKHGVNVVELCPFDAVPKGKTETGEHRCWWDDPSILLMLPWLRGVRRAKKHIRVVCDDDGKIVA